MKMWLGAGLLLIVFITTTSFFYRGEYTFPAYRILIVKHTYELSVYDSKGWLVTYPVVFGNKDLKDKMYQGDRETPSTLR